jgi:hypothetical protein
VDEALELGREKGVLADVKRSQVIEMVGEPLFVATPKQVSLAQQVGGAGILNGSAGGAGCIGDLDTGSVLGDSIVI